MQLDRVRALFLLTGLLLVAPFAMAGPGHSGGVDGANQNVPFFVSLDGSNVTGGPLLVPIDATAGTVVLSAVNRGSHPMVVELFLEETVRTTWTVPADRATHSFLQALDAAGNVSLDFSSPTAPDGLVQTIDVNVDWTGSCAYNPVTCIWKLLAWELQESVVVFPFQSTGAGTYQLTVPEPPAHQIVAELWADGALVATSSATKGNGGAATIQWSAPANADHVVLVRSVVFNQDRLYDDGNGPPITARASLIVEGPLAKSTPMPFGLAAVAVAVVLRRQG